MIAYAYMHACACLKIAKSPRQDSKLPNPRKDTHPTPNQKHRTCTISAPCSSYSGFQMSMPGTGLDLGFEKRKQPGGSFEGDPPPDPRCSDESTMVQINIGGPNAGEPAHLDSSATTSDISTCRSSVSA